MPFGRYLGSGIVGLAELQLGARFWSLVDLKSINPTSRECLDGIHAKNVQLEGNI